MRRHPSRQMRLRRAAVGRRCAVPDRDIRCLRGGGGTGRNRTLVRTKGRGCSITDSSRVRIAFTETGLARNSFTPASRASRTCSIWVWPVSMMIGTNGLGLAARCADHLAEIDPAHALHHPVQNDDVGIVLAQHRPGALGIVRFVDLDDAERLQDRPDKLAHMRVVVDDQDLQTVKTVAAHIPRCRAVWAPASPIGAMLRVRTRA